MTSRLPGAPGATTRPGGAGLRLCIRRAAAGALCVVILLATLPAGALAFCGGGLNSPLPDPAVSFLHSYRAGLKSPGRIAIDPFDNVYIADPARGTVLVRAPNGTVISEATNLVYPISVAADAAGRIYVGDGIAGSVAVYSPAWTLLFYLGQGGGEFIEPGDIAVDVATGNVYVTDSRDHVVKEFDSTGAFIRFFGGFGSGDGQFNFPAGIFVDTAANEVLVVDQLNFRVQIFDLAGNYQSCFGAGQGKFEGQFNVPQGIWVDGLARIYVADAFEGRVQILDHNGNFVDYLGQFGSGPGHLRGPMDMVIDSFGRLFVTSSGNARVEMFGLDSYTDPESVVPAKITIEPNPLTYPSLDNLAVAYIEVPGTPLAQIVESTVAANGVSATPSSSSTADQNRNMVPDMRIEFDRSALVATLPPQGEAMVTVTGSLGAMSFSGSEMITVEPAADTDGDGIPDIFETNTGVYVSATNTGTDPAIADSDGDGLSDLVETATGTFVSASDTGSNPNLADTDGDSMLDGFEVANGTDPNLAEWAVPALSPMGVGIFLALLLAGAGLRRRYRGAIETRGEGESTANKRIGFLLILIACGLSFPNAAYGLDPPHDFTTSIDCGNCHTPHHAPGGSLNTVDGNANLCISACHNPLGQASAKPYSDADQAFPGLLGTSHRWDSGPSGHVEASLTNSSTGAVMSGGAFTGRIERTYTITITAGGDAGSATFDWADSAGNNGSGTTGTGVALADGLTLNFTNGSGSPSFILGDTWTLYVRTDLRLPDAGDAFEEPMALRLVDGKVVCSVCHDQHSQVMTPFDPFAPAYGGPGTGAGRHFQRQDNDTTQMCTVCHSPRNVTTSAQGSHPVGVAVPGTGFYQSPAALLLDPGGNVQCATCHTVHFSDSGGANGGQGDGYLLADGMGVLCEQCHTLADTANGSHFNAATGGLWPGGQYGSSFPAHTAEKRGFCVNCHWPHGWPDDATPAQDYPKLWVERYDEADDRSDPDTAENLCFTCHDGNPAGTDIMGTFAKGTNGASIFHHPVKDSEQAAGRSVECVDCHNPHLATSANRIKGATGVDLAGLPVGPGTANNRDVVEYELCFKCHADDAGTRGSFLPRFYSEFNKRIEFDPANPSYHPVAAAGKNPDVPSLIASLSEASIIDCTDCHNNDTGPGAGGSDPAGPHGSNWAPILERRYETQDNTQESAAAYASCYACHRRVSILNDASFGEHKKHIQGKDTPCSVCHDPHGVAPGPTNPSGAHLINFRTDVVTPSSKNGKLEFIDGAAPFEGACSLTCHGKDHDQKDYKP